MQLLSFTIKGKSQMFFVARRLLRTYRLNKKGSSTMCFADVIKMFTGDIIARTIMYPFGNILAPTAVSKKWTIYDLQKVASAMVATALVNTGITQ